MTVRNHAIMKRQSNGRYTVTTFRSGVPFSHRDFTKSEAESYVRGFNYQMSKDGRRKKKR